MRKGHLRSGAIQVLFLSFCASVLGIEPSALAHQGHHNKHTEKSPPQTDEAKRKEAISFAQIGRAYVASVKPIFDRKCADCHGAATIHPWYYKILGVKQFIDRDIAEAKEHIEFSDGFPFKSHATPPEDLDAIRDSAQKRSMPPFSYRLLHQNSNLTEDEKKAVIDWVDQSKKLLVR